MSYNALTSGEIATSEPVKSSTLLKIKDNFDDHETRLLAVETGANTTYPPLIFRVSGKCPGAIDSILKTTTNFALQITGIRILVDVAGSAGTLEIDIKYKRGGGAWTSVLTTKPSVSYSAGNDAISSNAVLNTSETTLQAGDLIRLDITSGQTGAVGFLVRIDFEGV